MTCRTLSSRLRAFGRILVTVALVFSFFATPFNALRAQSGEPLAFIRDDEIEDYLRQLALPVFTAAGLPPQDIRFALIRSTTVNAFVAAGMNQFFYTGLLQMTETPEQLLGVIAHETGHIAGGHLARGQEALQGAAAQALLGLVLGVAAGIAAQRADVVVGAIGGAQEVARRNLLSYTRTQESAADEAAVEFLNRAGLPLRGLKEFMGKLVAQEGMDASRQSEFVRTHPLSRERYETLSAAVEQDPHANVTMPQDLAQRHARMRAKLNGFLQPEAVLLRSTGKESDVVSRYARTIALYRTARLEDALKLVETLTRDEPNNPWFHELKGQMLFENGRIAQSLPPFRRAVDLRPEAPLLRIAFAHALLESDSKAPPDEAIAALLDVTRRDPTLAQAWRLLAVAWGRQAEADPSNLAARGQVSYALAEESLRLGRPKQAREHAKRALDVLPQASPWRLRAQDLRLHAQREIKGDENETETENEDGEPENKPTRSSGRR